MKFAKPVKTRYLQIIILSEQSGNSLTSCAGWNSLFAGSGDVRDLGIIPGSNNSSE